MSTTVVAPIAFLTAVVSCVGKVTPYIFKLVIAYQRRYKTINQFTLMQPTDTQTDCYIYSGAFLINSPTEVRTQQKILYILFWSSERGTSIQQWSQNVCMSKFSLYTHARKISLPSLLQDNKQHDSAGKYLLAPKPNRSLNVH